MKQVLAANAVYIPLEKWVRFCLWTRMLTWLGVHCMTRREW